MADTYAIVDIFAGPGGLGEGFSAFRLPDGQHPFSISLSVENDEAAWRTLRMRAFLRKFGDRIPTSYYQFLARDAEEPDLERLHPNEWKAATQEVLQLTLGDPDNVPIVDRLLADIRQGHNGRTILIGGPPCQAYSLVGRARNRGVKGYDPAADRRHFLYEEYIRILGKLRPAAFVMENVKGLLSASVEGRAIFKQVLNDLASCNGRAGYVLVPFATCGELASFPSAPSDSKDFVVRCENFGIPQARHRIIIVGLRNDIAARLSESRMFGGVVESNSPVTVRATIGSMPCLRSGLSRSPDSAEAWYEVVTGAIKKVIVLSKAQGSEEMRRVRIRSSELLDQLPKRNALPSRKSREYPFAGQQHTDALLNWLADPELTTLPNHESRGHMNEDLARYFFAAVFGETCGRSPKAHEFPIELAPDHKNWASGKFADRFRVQPWDLPSCTITSHIAKDGHYFIHPDPMQCRSLTVREAARLQTFPDNYVFLGNRTQQYVQVGNAVPPYLALQIAELLHDVLTKAASRCSRR